MLKKQVAEIVEGLGYDKYGCADQILNLFKAEVERLTIIGGEEIEEIENEYPRKYGMGITTAMAQVQHDKDTLLGGVE